MTSRAVVFVTLLGLLFSLAPGMAQASNMTLQVDPCSVGTGSGADVKYYGESAATVHAVNSIYCSADGEFSNVRYVELGQAIEDSLNWPNWKYFMAWADDAHTTQTRWSYGDVTNSKSVGQSSTLRIYRHATDTDFWYWGINGTLRNKPDGTPGIQIDNMGPTAWVASDMERNSTSDTGKSHFYACQTRGVDPMSWSLWSSHHITPIGGEPLWPYMVNGTHYEWYSLTP